MQFPRVGRVRLTFQGPESCNDVLRTGLDFDGLPVRLTPADNRLRNAYLRDLRAEVDKDVVSCSFSEYAEVLSVEHRYFDDFLTIRNGNRLVKILLAQEIPCFVCVKDCDCRVWYPGQPSQCSICHESGHRALACPLSGLCRRCRQPGHMARECTQAWGPSVSVSSPASDGSSDESDHAMEQSSPSPSAVASVPVSAQSAPGAVPTTDDSDHVMEELPRSSPKAPAVFAPVSVPAQSVTTSAAPDTVTVCASPVTVPVSVTVSAPPVTVTGPVSPAIVTAPIPATVTASSAIVTASLPATVTVPFPTTSSSTVPASQVSVAPSNASSDREFRKFSGDRDTVDSKWRAYVRKCMTKEISEMIRLRNRFCCCCFIPSWEADIV